MVYSTRRFGSCLTLYYFVLVFFSPFSIAITSLGEERANICSFRTFVDLRLFGFVCFLFHLVSGKGYSFWLWHSLDYSLTVFAQQTFTYRYIDDVGSETHKICRVIGIHLSTWTWNKGNNGDCSSLPHTWIIISTLTMESLLLSFTTNGMASIFP